MKAGVFLAALAAAAFAAYLLWPSIDTRDSILITGAVIEPVSGDRAALIVAMRNEGRPDHLRSAEVDGAEGEAVGLPSGSGLAIPTGHSSLATEGAHFRVPWDASKGDGALVPASLRFERAGEVTFRARITITEDGEMPGDAHRMSMQHFVDVGPGEPAPSVSLDVIPREDGWLALIATEEFSFNAEAVDLPHVPGEGHGHIYLGGLKLGRVLGERFEIGSLPPGTHEVTVTLNTNDHGVYRVGGEVVSASAMIDVD